MRLLSGSVMTRKDHRVADAWPGPWTGISINATRVTSERAGKVCASRLAAKARELCDFPVVVIFDPAPYAHPVEGQPGVFDAPQHLTCMWPAGADPHHAPARCALVRPPNQVVKFHALHESLLCSGEPAVSGPSVSRGQTAGSVWP